MVKKLHWAFSSNPCGRSQFHVNYRNRGSTEIMRGIATAKYSKPMLFIKAYCIQRGFHFDWSIVPSSGLLDANLQ